MVLIEIVLQKDGKVVKSFKTENDEYFSLNRITVGNVIEKEVYTYNLGESRLNRIVFSHDRDVLSKHVASLDELK